MFRATLATRFLTIGVLRQFQMPFRNRKITYRWISYFSQLITAHIYIYVYVSAYICKYICIFVCICMCIYTCVFTCEPTHTYISIYVRTRKDSKSSLVRKSNNEESKSSKITLRKFHPGSELCTILLIHQPSTHTWCPRP